MEKVIVKRYSEAFRRQVVREYEAGASLQGLQRKYGIGAIATISRWVKRYSYAGLRHELVRIQTMSEQNQVTKLEARIRELESAVSKLTLDKLMLESTLEVVERDFGIEVKKNGQRRLSKQGRSVR